MTDHDGLDGYSFNSHARTPLPPLLFGPYVAAHRFCGISLTYGFIGGNIGNAKIEGLQEDLGMVPDQYNWCLTVFFFTYAAFEVPSNLLLKRLRPSVWLPTIMVAWGTVMTLMGIVQNYHGLLIARIFLGVTEAGLFPGVAVSIADFSLMFHC